jgi:hypothetical protein
VFSEGWSFQEARPSERITLADARRMQSRQLGVNCTLLLYLR